TISKTLSADLQTPVGIYLKIRDLYPQSALLESSDYHTAQNSFSFIGVSPIGRFSVLQNKIYSQFPNQSEIKEDITPDTDVVKKLDEYISSYEVIGDQQNFNGFLGYTGYDAVRYFEDVEIMEKEKTFQAIPDMMYILYRFIIVMNHFRNQLTIIENLSKGEESQMNILTGVLFNNNIARYGFKALDDVESPLTDEEYKEMVKKGVKHTLRGDVFQIVLSRRFSRGYQGDDFNVYRALRCINPSPYLFYFDFGHFRIFGSSPETHLRVADGKAYIDPIAGTFKRTGNDKQDMELAQQLLEDEKENTEHIMLVDLARNDLSRGAGNVHIEFLREIQYYSHVIHMVSRVSANITEKTEILRLFADTFPAGTLSGAPKVRAMQLINEIEPHSRGTYGGCIGYIGFNKELNQAITIRSFLSYGNRLYFQAGAGIVAHSQPENELQELNNKLGALMKAIEYAEEV
ncbi:MAG: anthranilate synthase component I family protein, partial [Odoribacter sp.]|nr:anthranilate synthase component I family protein [Odoribacter sp.]